MIRMWKNGPRPAAAAPAVGRRPKKGRRRRAPVGGEARKSEAQGRMKTGVPSDRPCHRDEGRFNRDGVRSKRRNGPRGPDDAVHPAPAAPVGVAHFRLHPVAPRPASLRMHYKILIADDEPLAREKLRAYFAAAPDFEIVGEAADGAGVLAEIRRLQPDAVYLDIEMPGIDGLNVARALAHQSAPLVVFTTAHSRYAVEAFAVSVTDYLLKPFDRGRFLESVAKLRDTLGRRPAAPAATGRKRFLVKAQGRYAVVGSEEIEWIEAAANYVVLHTASGNHVLRSTLTDILKELGDELFYRTGRSHAVCLTRITEVRAEEPGLHEVVLRSGARLRLQRDFRELQQRLEACQHRSAAAS